MKRRGYIIIVVLLLVGTTFGAYFGRNLLFSDQWPVYDGLRQTAAIVFGLSGAYIAIVYPAALAALLRRQEIETKEVTAFRHLLTSMELSFGVLVVVLIASFCAPVVRHSEWCIKRVVLIRGASFAIAAILTIIELISIVFILRPLDSFTRDVERGQSARRIVNATLPATAEDDDD